MKNVHVSDKEFKMLAELENQFIMSLMFGIPVPKIQGPKPLWHEARFCYIEVGGKRVMAKSDGTTAWKLEGYEPTGEVYSDWTFVRYCRGMDL